MRLNQIAFALIGVALVGCTTRPPADIQPVTGFEVDRYLGTWYEIARLDHSFERGLSDVTANYTLQDNGTIKVVNRGRDEAQGDWNEATGKAKFRGDADVGSLKVSFFGPFYGGYHIVELDEDYNYAMVAGPTKNFLWILAREPHLDETLYDRLIDAANALGFPTKELIRVEHSEER